MRVPPENARQVRARSAPGAGQNGELKNQHIGSQDVTKQYTDLESRLAAARTMEERLLQIIKTGKGEIKDLVAAEKELGVWRTKIEEMEGEIRYLRQPGRPQHADHHPDRKGDPAPRRVDRHRARRTCGIEVDDVDKAQASRH